MEAFITIPHLTEDAWIKFMKFHKISLHGVILIMKLHNSLKILNAGELARILNHGNDMRKKQEQAD